MVRLPQYLYKYPHSNNFYFKIRIPNQIIQKYSLLNQFFISSLRTPNKNNAQRLVLIIKSNFDKELRCMDYSEALQDIEEFRQAQYEQSNFEFFFLGITGIAFLSRICSLSTSLS